MVTTVALTLDDSVHDELWRKKLAYAAAEGRKNVPWEEFVVKALRAFPVKSARSVKRKE